MNLDQSDLGGMDMLVLSRRRGEEVVIIVPPSDKPTMVTIKMCSVVEGKVRFGLTAPAEVKINRGEVQRRVDDAAEVG